MKRVYSLLLIFLLMLSSVFPAVPSVAATTEDDNVYADGEYDLPFEVWQADKDEKSVADGYLEKPAKVIIEDGEYTIQATLKNDSWWQYFQTESGGSFTNVEELSKDEAADTSLVQFKVDDLDEVLDSKIHVIVTGIPGLDYDNKYDIRFNFDTNDLPLAEDTDPEEEPTEPEDPKDPVDPEQPDESEDPEEGEEDTDQPEEPETPEEEPVDPEQPDEDSEETPEDAEEDTDQPEVLEIADGDYTIGFEALHAEEDKASGMARYIEPIADLSVKDGKTFLTVTLTDHETVTGFQVDRNGELVEPTEEEVNEEENTRAVTYELDELHSAMKAQVQYTVGAHNGDQPLRLEFDYDSLQEKQSDNSDATYQDGEYDLPFEVWQADKDEISVADDYLDKPATLTVEDGKYTIEATLKNSSWWQYFKVASGEDFIDVTEVSKDEANDTKVVQFEVDDLGEILNAKVHIIVTGIPGFVYDNKYDIRFSFDPSDIPLAEETDPGVDPEEPGEDPEDPKEDPVEPGVDPEDPKEDPEDPKDDPKETEKDPENADTVATYKDGEYDLPFEVWQANKDEISVADGYLEKPAKLIVEDGKYTVQITLKNSSWWQYFKVASGNEFIDVTEVSKDEANDTKVVQFEVDDIDAILDAKVHIIVTGIPGLDYDNKYDIRFNFDTSDIPLNEGKIRPDPKEDPKPKPNPNPSNPTPTPGNGSGKSLDNKSEKICEDGEYDLPFEVLHADKDQTSVADEYFEKPAKLIVKDGKFTVETTLKNSSWWQSFQVASNDGFVDVTEISKNNAEDTSVVQFNVQNLNEILNGKVHIIVTGIPGFEYDNKYDIRFNFDPSEIPLENCLPGKNGTNDDDKNTGIQVVDKKDDGNKDVDDLDFDRDADGSLTKSDNQQGKGDNINPKTADTSKVIVFVLLLVGSMVPLVIKFRKGLSLH